MNIFFIIVGISVAGVGVVIWLLMKEKDEEETVEPFSLEALHQKESRIEPEAPPAKKASPFAKLKLPAKKKEKPAADAEDEEPSGKPNLLEKFGLKKILAGVKLPKKSKRSIDEDEPPAESGNPLQKILSKFKFGKKDADLEDIPQPTNFASLKAKLNQFSKGTSKQAEDKPLPLMKDTGTFSMKTLPEEPAATAKEELSEDEKISIEREVDAATELAELKAKYTKMEKLLAEKNAELEKSKGSHDSEASTRKDFNKVKDLLEKELKEVKDRVKTVRQDLANETTEKENALKRIKQLEEKCTKLEKEILGLEKENETLRGKMKQAGLKEEPRPAPAAPAAPVEPSAEIEPPAPPPAAAPMDLPPAFKEAPKKMTKDDIAKFEESLGFSAAEPAAEAPAAPPPSPPEMAPPPPATESAAPAAAPMAEPPAPEPVSAPPPEPEPSPEPDVPPRDDEDDSDDQGGGFLKLTPDPMSGPSGSDSAQPSEPPTNPEDKKE